MHSDPDIQKFQSISASIQAQLKHANWMQLHGYELVKFFLKACLFAFGFYLFSLATPFFLVGGFLIMSYAYTGILVSGIHQASHRTFVKSILGNKLWGYFFTDFLIAKSSKWWYDRHIIIHHPHPNDPVKEPKLFYFGWLNKYAYFFLVPYLIIPWFIVSSVCFLRKKPIDLFIYLILATSGMILSTLLFMQLGYPPLIAFVIMISMKSLLAPLFMHLALFNHIGLENPPTAHRWITQQTLTTRNIKSNWFLAGLGGNAFLDGHLEHHLFPRVSNHMISTIRPQVKTFMEQEGYLYLEEGYVSCLKNSLKHYDHLFNDLPKALW